VTIVSIGEILWDLFPDSERLGGAAFNFSVHARRCGHDVVFLSAVGEDDRGETARRRAVELGLPGEYIQTVVEAETGFVTVKVDASGLPDFTLHRPAAYDKLHIGTDQLKRIALMEPQWIYYGTLHQIYEHTLQETRKLVCALPAARKFYDVNLRRDCYTPELLWDLMKQSDVVKLNDDEAAEIDRLAGRTHGSLMDFTAHWAETMGWQAVAATRGSKGCVVRIGNDYAESLSFKITVADTVGAGDAFSAAFLHGLSNGWNAASCGDFGNRVGALVASKPGGVPDWTMEAAFQLC
jgi:fructokinase